MTARLTDEQVAAWVALADPARSDHAIALACEVQEYRTRRCDGCAHASRIYAGTVDCSRFGSWYDADHACSAWTAKP